MAAVVPDLAPELNAIDQNPVSGSIYDFARDLVGYGRHPPKAEWPRQAKIAVSFVINYEEVQFSQIIIEVQSLR